MDITRLTYNEVARLCYEAHSEALEHPQGSLLRRTLLDTAAAANRERKLRRAAYTPICNLIGIDPEDTINGHVMGIVDGIRRNR